MRTRSPTTPPPPKGGQHLPQPIQNCRSSTGHHLLGVRHPSFSRSASQTIPLHPIQQGGASTIQDLPRPLPGLHLLLTSGLLGRNTSIPLRVCSSGLVTHTSPLVANSRILNISSSQRSFQHLQCPLTPPLVALPPGVCSCITHLPVDSSAFSPIHSRFQQRAVHLLRCLRPRWLRISFGGPFHYPRGLLSARGCGVREGGYAPFGTLPSPLLPSPPRLFSHPGPRCHLVH